MALTNFLKQTIAKNINIPRWIGFSQWKQLGLLFSTLGKRSVLFPSISQQETESFEKIMQRLQLSEADLMQRQQVFQRLKNIWLGLLMLMLAYGLYLIWQGAWLGVMSLLVLCLMVLCQSFQYHFWSFQIKQRRLDCTLQECWQFTRGQWRL